jgi:DNA-binding MarR family transcriptional regulator
MNSDRISQVRSFNRTVSKRIGALNDSFLDRGRPLGEARLLFEIGRDGAEVRELRARLELDSGYVSRLLRSLERQGLVAGHTAANDGRVRRVKLTRKGQRELAELDRRSDAFAQSVLAPLGTAQQDRLVAAMVEVERLMQASAVRIDVEPPTSADGRWCLNAFYQDLAGRFDTGFDPAKSRSVSAEELVPPAGALVVARLDGRPVGCGALRTKGGDVGEIKHLWVDSTARGLGIGRRILDKLETLAREFGLHTVRLDTNRALTEAQALYRASGYREVAPFNDEPYAHHWFEKSVL